MNRTTGRNIGERHYSDYSPKSTLNPLLLTGICIQTLVLLHLALTPTKSTPDSCPRLHIGTTGNIYISEPRTNEGGR